MQAIPKSNLAPQLPAIRAPPQAPALKGPIAQKHPPPKASIFPTPRSFSDLALWDLPIPSQL